MSIVQKPFLKIFDRNVLLGKCTSAIFSVMVDRNSLNRIPTHCRCSIPRQDSVPEDLARFWWRLGWAASCKAHSSTQTKSEDLSPQPYTEYHQTPSRLLTHVGCGLMLLTLCSTSYRRPVEVLDSQAVTRPIATPLEL